MRVLRYIVDFFVDSSLGAGYRMTIVRIVRKDRRVRRNVE